MFKSLQSLFRHKADPRRNNRRQRLRPQLQLEPLEDRIVMSADLAFAEPLLGESAINVQKEFSASRHQDDGHEASDCLRGLPPDGDDDGIEGSDVGTAGTTESAGSDEDPDNPPE